MDRLKIASEVPDSRTVSHSDLHGLKKKEAQNSHGIDAKRRKYRKTGNSQCTGLRLPATQAVPAASLQLLQLFQAEFLDVDGVVRLLNSGADANVADEHGRTPLHEAARVWSRQVCELLLDSGADPNASDANGATPLHTAAACDRAAICRLLVGRGADTEAADGQQLKPLFYAARADADRAAKALLLAGCECCAKDYRGRTALFLAAEMDCSAAAGVLVQHGADISCCDVDGQVVLVPLLENMPSVAVLALDRLQEVNRTERKERLYLERLDPVKADRADIESRTFKTVMKAATETGNRDVLGHRVIQKMIQVQWRFFGRIRAIAYLIVHLVTILLWTSFSLIKSWYRRYEYDLAAAEDVARLVLLVLAILFTLYGIAEEIYEYSVSLKFKQRWTEWKRQRINTDLSRLHEDDVDAKKFLNAELQRLDEETVRYFKDYWNYLDWCCYIVLLVSTATHLADVFAAGGAGDLRVARWHVRVTAVGIAMLWTRLLKCVRPFEFFGPFVVMLSNTLADFAKFLFLYLEFFIPFACIFWTVVGGTENIRSVDVEASNTYLNYTKLNRTGASVTYFTQVDDLLFMMFRLTLVDIGENMYQDMYTIDKYTCQVCLGIWFAISCILFLNLFIAQLSETFKNVYDNSKVAAVMEKASFINEAYDKMMMFAKIRFHAHLHSQHCNPMELRLDADPQNPEEDGEMMRKATLQIRDTLQGMQMQLNLLTQMQTGEEADGVGDDDYAVSLPLLETNVELLGVELQQVKNQCASLQRDVTTIKETLNDLALLMLGTTARAERHERQHRQQEADSRQAADSREAVHLVQVRPVSHLQDESSDI